MEEIVLVDLDDNIIGYSEKMEAHKEKRLHRAFSVFIFNGRKMLLQRRHINKYHSGGLWANACCSHPKKDENIEEAVKRRLKEELGIYSCVKEAFSFVYYSNYGELSEFECDHVFIGEYSGEILYDKDEIVEIKWIDIDELKKDLLEHPQNYATWFIIAFVKVVENFKK